ncbi:MAG: sigma-70 family RNA polymerase sigma factor [Clostridia bacterium]|nr:sigma-70 family RNA polymerase sigma factor [Clostridia bacterium]
MTYAERFAEEYLGKIFYFCLKKTGNEHHAEELASDISYEILAALARGNKPAEFSPWVWTIAKNRHAKWAKKKYYSPDAGNADIDEMEYMLESEDDVESALLLDEDLKLVRRELAFIRSDYREILLAHYFGEKSVSVISRELGIPLGTVKTKLQNGRKILKEGMNMAREFGKRSYNPEEITFVNNCNHFGKNGQPWTILNHSLYKNIFLEAYGEPKTAEELSLELGIALPYMEDELKFLKRETFVTFKDGKYETAFPILSREAQLAMHGYNTGITEEATALICEAADKLSAAYEEQTGKKLCGEYQSYEDAKWALVCLIFDEIKCRVCPSGSPHTKRPNGGEWDIVGFEDLDISVPAFVGQHGNKGNFSQYKYNFHRICDRTPSFLEDSEAELLRKLALGETIDEECEDAKKLVKYGYARIENGKMTANIAVFEKDITITNAAALAEIRALIGKAEALLSASAAEAKKILLRDIPESLTGNAAAIDIMHKSLMIEKGYIIEKALEKGLLCESEGTLGAHMIV